MEVEQPTISALNERATFASILTERVSMLQHSDDKTFYFGQRAISTGLCTHPINFCGSTLCKGLFLPRNAYENSLNRLSDKITQLWCGNDNGFVSKPAAPAFAQQQQQQQCALSFFFPLLSSFMLAFMRRYACNIRI